MGKILIINSVCGTGSTGRIAAKTAAEYESAGWEVKYAYGRNPYVPQHCVRWAVRIGNYFSVMLHALLTRLFDLHGTGPCSYFATKKFLRWAEEWKPDVVWLHLVHGYYINYELLFKWLKRHPEIVVKWTLHDCWAFTGHCGHFILANCQRWVDGCRDCPEKNEYPLSWGFSAAKQNWKCKREAFCGIRDMTLITPSQWLADLTRRSFMKEYKVEVVHNTIDTSVFRQTPSDFRERMGLAGKRIVLGVAIAWDRRKGLDDFHVLRRLLDERFAIVLVGLTKMQVASLPEGVIGLTRTHSTRELAEIYSSADWFFNPTREDNYPTVNLEARACGCRVVTYDIGGCAETVDGYEKAWVLKGVDKSPESFARLLEEYYADENHRDNSRV